MISVQDKEENFEHSLEESFDSIDAGLFSGDAFHSRGKILRFRRMIARWQRGLKSAESTVKFMERLEAKEKAEQQKRNASK